ncbi:MAG: hypothetical protein B0A82_08370 [Alkalinema sp. CACIAM 70d]|nr:MAG: hypothetical protein B0A82_08370 [Alkalinema sp. CACIAM 70d]
MLTRLAVFGVTLLLCHLFPYLTGYASETLRPNATLVSAQTLSPKAQADALYQQGNQLFKKNRWRLALEKYKQALWMYLEIGDKGAIADTLVQIGVIDNWLNPVGLSKTSDVSAYVRQAVATRKQILEKLNLKDEGNGREFFQEALRIRREMKDHAGEAAALLKLGELYKSSGEEADYKTPEKLYEKAIHIYQELGDQAKQRDTLIKLGNFIASRLGEDSAQAVAVFERALTIYPANSKGRMETLVKLAEKGDDFPPQYCSTLQHMEYCEQSLAITRVLGDKAAEQDIFSKIVLALPGFLKSSDSGATDDEIFQQTLWQVNDLYQIKADRDAIRQISLQLTQVYYDPSLDNPEKEEMYSRINQLRKRAIAIYQNSGDQREVADTLLKFVELYIQLDIPYKDFSTTLVLKEALEIYQKLGDKRGEARALYLMAVTTGCAEYLAKKGEFGACKPEQALDLLQKSLALYRQLGDRAGEAQVLSEMASNYIANRRRGMDVAKANKALELYQQASAIYKAIGEKTKGAEALFSVADIYRRLKRFDLARQVYHQALILTDGFLGEGNSIYCLMADVGSMDDRFDLNGYLRLSDSYLSYIGRGCGQGDAGKVKPRPGR